MHVSIWTRFMASSMQAALHMDPRYEKNLQLFNNSEFENIKGLFGSTRMMIAGNSEIKCISRRRCELDKSKSVRLLGLRVMLGKTARSRRCNKKVEWWSVNLEDVLYLQRTARIRWRSGWLRVENLPRSQSIGPSPQNSSRPTRKEHHLKNSVIEKSSCQCSMTLDWKGKITKILVLLPQGILKNMPKHLTMEEKESKWYQGCAAEYGGKWDLRASQMVENFENSGHPVFQTVSPLGRGILKKRNNRETIHFNGEYGTITLLYRNLCREPALYLRSSLKVVWTEFRRSKPKQTRNCSQDVSRHSHKTGRSQVIGWYSKTTGCIGKPTAPEFEGFQFDAIYEQNWISPYNGEILPSDREETAMLQLLLMMTDGKSALRCAKILQKPYASIDADKEIGPVLNIEIASIIVPGTAVQVPSLSSPGYYVCILISRGHERFVNEIHSYNNDIVNCSSSLRGKEDNLDDVCFESSKPAAVNHGQGSQDSNNVKTKVEPTNMHRETVASTIRVKPGLLKKRQRRGAAILRQYIWKQSPLTWIKRSPRRTELGLQFLDARNARGIQLRLASQSVSQIWSDTTTKMSEKQMERGIGMVYTQYEKENFEINWREFCTRKQGLKSVKKKMRIKIYSCDPQSLRRNDHSTEIAELRDDSLQMDAIYLSSTRSTLHCRNWISGRRKGTERRKINNLLRSSWSVHQRCRWSRIYYRYYETKKVQYQIHWRPEQDAVYWIHLSTAQDAGLEVWQTGSDAIITNQSVPKECVVKVVSESGKRFFRETVHTSRTTKSNIQTVVGSYEIQYCEHASGNRE